MESCDSGVEWLCVTVRAYVVYRCMLRPLGGCTYGALSHTAAICWDSRDFGFETTVVPKRGLQTSATAVDDLVGCSVQGAASVTTTVSLNTSRDASENRTTAEHF